MSTRKSASKKDSAIEDLDIESDVESDLDDVEEEIDDVEEEIDDVEDIDLSSKDIDDEDEEDHGEAQSIVASKRSILQSLQREASDVTIVAPEKRITSEYMTFYEYSMVVGTRATHISEGAPLYIDPSGISSAREIAIKEIDMKVCPLSVVRKIRNKGIELWEVNEMTQPM